MYIAMESVFIHFFERVLIMGGFVGWYFSNLMREMIYAVKNLYSFGIILVNSKTK
jgi:hypothetical protein